MNRRFLEFLRSLNSGQISDFLGGGSGLPGQGDGEIGGGGAGNLGDLLALFRQTPFAPGLPNFQPSGNTPFAPSAPGLIGTPSFNI